jgi:hypothetical protein
MKNGMTWRAVATAAALTAFAAPAGLPQGVVFTNGVTQGLSKEQIWFALEQERQPEQIHEGQAREKLRRQVSRFMAYLEQEGVVGKKGK